MKKMQRAWIILLVILFLTALLGKLAPVKAQTTSKFGIHIMRIEELPLARNFFNDLGIKADQQQYVTLPLTLADLSQAAKWQQFFSQAKELKLIPIVRLTTKFEGESWQIPSQKDIVDQLTFLSSLPWPTEQRYVIAYNEVNHANEWGGRLDPVGYAKVLHFVADWAHTEKQPLVILPAALDLSAPNSKTTRDAFAFWNQVNQADPQVLAQLDAWNSHSYPNPAFSSSPKKTGRQSVSGFESELVWLDAKIPKKLEVFITETGWENNSTTQNWLSSYYEYSFDQVWSKERVRAVTPFILKGEPGPFAAFSFLDGQNQPTHQYLSLKAAISRLAAQHELSLSITPDDEL